MEMVRAEIKDAELIYELVCNTVRTVYPKYYPVEAVDFFCRHHSKNLYFLCAFNLQRDCFV